MPQFAKASEFCNWGVVPPRPFVCNGKNYLYGTAACTSGTYRNIFCKEALGNDGAACAGDNDPDTIACYAKMTAPSTQPPKTNQTEYCNWGFSGARYFFCNGQNFVYGSASCSTGFFNNIFCKQELSGNPKDCANDQSEMTMQCYEKLIQGQNLNFSDQKNDLGKVPGGQR